MIAIFALATLTPALPSLASPQPSGDPDPYICWCSGDSIMWGQGLKTPDKAWWRLKNWLQEKTGREVREKIEAHSGAAIEAAPGSERFTSQDGEVNLLTPTINEQVDDARKFYGDPAQVDLILVNGCINDVDVRNLLDASTSLDLLGDEHQREVWWSNGITAAAHYSGVSQCLCSGSGLLQNCLAA